MPVLPPGPAFLLRKLPTIASPPILALTGVYAVCHLLGVSAPLWLVLVLSVASFPIAFYGYITWQDWRAWKKAEALGATLPPLVEKSDSVISDDEASYPRDFLFNIAAKYGHHFVISLFYIKRFLTNEPEHIKAFLATDFGSYEKGEGFRELMKSLLGVGVFNADGDMWKFHRSMTRPFFTKDRISHFEIFDRHASDAIQQMKDRMRDGYSVNWQDLVSRFTLDSATEFLFGKDVRSLSAGLPYPPTSDMARTNGMKPESDEFAQAFQQAQLASSLRNRFQEGWPLFEFWHDKVEAQKSAIDRFIRPILQDALHTKAQSASSPSSEKVSEEDTLLSQLLKVTDDPDIIRDETLNILLAGRDTTACTLTFAIYRLAEHPDVMQRLRAEVLSVVGPTRRPTYEDIRNMKFLRAVINETLRLYPPVPINLRTAAKDVVLPPTTPGGKGIFVPAGQKVVYSVFMMHRRTDLWGPDALKFDPDRFVDERLHKYLTPNPFIFLPFNAGPRICLGQQFAYNEVSFMLVRLLQQVSSIELTPEVAPESIVPPGYTDSLGSDGTDRVMMGSHLTMFAKGGLWVKMKDATPNE